MTADLAITEVTSGAILVYLLQLAKKWFPQLEQAQGWILRGLSAVWAIVSTILVSWEWTAHPEGGGTLTLVIPSLAVALTAIWHVLSQFSLQEIIYRATAKQSRGTDQPIAGVIGRAVK